MEKLYNGIILPEEWPPKYSWEQYMDKQPCPYLETSPEVIDVTVGRQLFVDDFLIEDTDTEPEYHNAVKYEGNPIFKAEKDWEKEELASACPKSGGIWFDKDDGKYKMWYEGGWLHQMAYAESVDGIHWERPDLDNEPGTNKILIYNDKSPRKIFGMGDDLPFDETDFRSDSTTVFIDYDADPNEKYKLYLRAPGGGWSGITMTSPDGVHWGNLSRTMEVFDRSTIFYNPFRKKWVYSIRDVATVTDGWRRVRSYAEADGFTDAFKNKDMVVNWLAADRDTKADPYIDFKPQLYNVDAVGYESIMLGMFQVHKGPENDACEKNKMPKITELIPMYSRDGFHFTRPSEKPIICATRTEGSWDRGYVQSVGGICHIHKDELWIYYIGFAGDDNAPNIEQANACMYGNGATGIAKLRRDGFVSRNADKKAQLLTRKLTFEDKKYMFANFDGTLKVTLLDGDGNVLAESKEITDNNTCRMIELDDFDVSSLCGGVFKIRFELENGKLYSFWFSDNENGRSGGAEAAGLIED